MGEGRGAVCLGRGVVWGCLGRGWLSRLTPLFVKDPLWRIGPTGFYNKFIKQLELYWEKYHNHCTLSGVNGNGHVKYMVSPFFYFYMITWHVL